MNLLIYSNVDFNSVLGNTEIDLETIKSNVQTLENVHTIYKLKTSSIEITGLRTSSSSGEKSAILYSKPICSYLEETSTYTCQDLLSQSIISSDDVLSDEIFYDLTLKFPRNWNFS
jgi:hypothetical protein